MPERVQKILEGRAMLKNPLLLLLLLLLVGGAVCQRTSLRDRFTSDIAGQLGVPPGGATGARPPPPPPQDAPSPTPPPPPSSPVISPSPVPVSSPSVPPEPVSSGEEKDPAGAPASIDDVDGKSYFFKLPAAPPGFPPPDGYPTSAGDIDSYISQVEAFGAFGAPVEGNGAVRFPYMGSVVYYGSHRCTGVLLKPSVLMTAAHCVDPRRVRSSRLGVKFFRIKDGRTSEELIQVTKVVMHSQYRAPTAGNDVALLKLQYEPTEAIGIRHVGQGDLELDLEERYLSLGWGGLSSSSGFSPILQRTYLPIVPQNVCQQLIASRMIGTEFCAGAEGQGPCTGDDGGPLIRPGLEVDGDLLIGIATSKLACGQYQSPDIFTRLSDFTKWMLIELDNI